MNTTYAMETIARQRMDETARNARNASQRRQITVRAGWHFPTVSFPSRATGFIPRPA